MQHSNRIGVELRLELSDFHGPLLGRASHPERPQVVKGFVEAVENHLVVNVFCLLQERLYIDVLLLGDGGLLALRLVSFPLQLQVPIHI